MIKYDLLHEIIYYVNPFHGTGLFRKPLKTSENLWLSDAFKGVSKEIIGMKLINTDLIDHDQQVSL